MKELCNILHPVGRLSANVGQGDKSGLMLSPTSLSIDLEANNEPCVPGVPCYRDCRQKVGERLTSLFVVQETRLCLFAAHTLTPELLAIVNIDWACAGWGLPVWALEESAISAQDFLASILCQMLESF